MTELIILFLILMVIQIANNIFSEHMRSKSFKDLLLRCEIIINRIDEQDRASRIADIERREILAMLDSQNSENIHNLTIVKNDLLEAASIVKRELIENRKKENDNKEEIMTTLHDQTDVIVNAKDTLDGVDTIVNNTNEKIDKIDQAIGKVII